MSNDWLEAWIERDGNTRKSEGGCLVPETSEVPREGVWARLARRLYRIYRNEQLRDAGWRTVYPAAEIRKAVADIASGRVAETEQL